MRWTTACGMMMCAPPTVCSRLVLLGAGVCEMGNQKSDESAKLLLQTSWLPRGCATASPVGALAAGSAVGDYHYNHTPLPFPAISSKSVLLGPRTSTRTLPEPR